MCCTMFTFSKNWSTAPTVVLEWTNRRENKKDSFTMLFFPQAFVRLASFAISVQKLLSRLASVPMFILGVGSTRNIRPQILSITKSVKEEPGDSAKVKYK